MSRCAQTARVAASVIMVWAVVQSAVFAQVPALPAQSQVRCLPVMQGTSVQRDTGLSGSVVFNEPEPPEPVRYPNWRTFVQSLTLGVHPGLAALGVDTLVEWDDDELYPYRLFEDVAAWLRGRPTQPAEVWGGYGYDEMSSRRMPVVPVEVILPVFGPTTADPNAGLPFPLYHSRPETGGIYVMHGFVHYRQLDVNPPEDVKPIGTFGIWCAGHSDIVFEERSPLRFLEDVASLLRGRPTQPAEVWGDNEYETMSQPVPVVPVDVILPVFAPATESNPRLEELLNQTEDLKQLGVEWRRFWYTDQPSHLTPHRVGKQELEIIVEDGTKEANRDATVVEGSLFQLYIERDPGNLAVTNDDLALGFLCEGVRQALAALGVCIDVDTSAPRGPRSCCELDLGGLGVRMSWEKKESGNSLSLSVMLKKD